MQREFKLFLFLIILCLKSLALDKINFGLVELDEFRVNDFLYDKWLFS
jgi:hypothetical protein